MFKKFKMWVGAVAVATAGFVGGLTWDDVRKVGDKLEETGAKSQCEARVTADTCSIDQACRWDFDKKICGEKK